MFMSVYVSDYCNESWDTITIDWDYDSFLRMYNNVMYFAELRQAVHLDQEREDNHRRQKEEVANQRLNRR